MTSNDWKNGFTMMNVPTFLILFCIAASSHAQVQRVWLPHREGTPARLTISCETAKSSAVIVRAVDATARDVPFFNTSLGGKGAKHADPAAKYFASEDSYMLLSFTERSPMKVEIKSLDGHVPDTTEWPAK
jgi:hypothetical protein